MGDLSGEERRQEGRVLGAGGEGKRHVAKSL